MKPDICAADRNLLSAVFRSRKSGNVDSSLIQHDWMISHPKQTGMDTITISFVGTSFQSRGGFSGLTTMHKLGAGVIIPFFDKFHFRL